MDSKRQFSKLVKTNTDSVSSDHLVNPFKNCLKVGDVMSKDVITISSDETVVSAALKMMFDNTISCLVVNVIYG